MFCCLPVFPAKKPCVDATCPMNSKCRPDFYEGDYDCPCDPEYVFSEGRCVGEFVINFDYFDL